MTCAFALAHVVRPGVLLARKLPEFNFVHSREEGTDRGLITLAFHPSIPILGERKLSGSEPSPVQVPCSSPLLHAHHSTGGTRSDLSRPLVLAFPSPPHSLPPLPFPSSPLTPYTSNYYLSLVCPPPTRPIAPLLPFPILGLFLNTIPGSCTLVTPGTLSGSTMLGMQRYIDIFRNFRF